MGPGREAGKSSVVEAVARTASLTGLPYEWLLDLDEPGIESVRGLAEERARAEAWPNSTELLAHISDQLGHLIAMLRSGIPAVMVKQSSPLDAPPRYPRPSWWEADTDPGDEIVVRPAEAFALMRR